MNDPKSKPEIPPTDQPQQSLSPHGEGPVIYRRAPGEMRRILIVLAVAFTVGVVLSLMLAPMVSNSTRGGAAVGAKAPAIVADGWINGTPEPLEGNVSVVVAWATWCIPCRIEAPHLREVHAQYAPRGVQFIGLTNEEEEYLPEIEAFVEEAGLPYPNGYGATETLVNLEVTAIPAIWVIDRNGTIVWNMSSPGSLEEAIDQALDAS